MEFILTESQLLRCIKENRDDVDLSNSLKRMNSFVKNMVNKVYKAYDLNLKMLSTWGTSVAGLIMPLDEFIKSGNFSISEEQRYLVLAGVAFLIFFEGKRGLTKILTKIKEEGLDEVFDATYMKGLQLKESFAEFLTSTRIVTSQLLEIVSYTFLLPIIVDIQHIVSGTSNVAESAALITERLLASGVVLLSREFLFQFMKKLISKLK